MTWISAIFLGRHQFDEEFADLPVQTTGSASLPRKHWLRPFTIRNTATLIISPLRPSYP